MAAAGTLTLTQNSTAVTGSGTAFTTALAAGGFIVATVGGTAYTLGIKSIESNTALTLQVAYNGPTTSGVAFDYVPFATLNLITSALAAQVTYAIRAANLDRNNWQQIFSGTGNVTVTLPDGTSWTGPAWNSIASLISGKMDKSQNLNDVADKTKALTNLGLGDAATKNIGTVAGTVAGGADSRITGALQTTGGVVSGQITSTLKGSSFYAHPNGFDGTWNYHADIRNGDGTVIIQNALYLQSGQYWAERDILTQGGNAFVWEKRNDGSFRSPGTVYAAGTALTSDRRLKSAFEEIEYSLDDIDKIIPKFYDKATPDNADIKTRELGIVAQDLQEVIPDLVSSYFWNEKFPDLLSVNYSGLGAWLVGYVAKLKNDHEDRLFKMEQAVASRDAIIDDLAERLKAIDGLDK